jgi:hypothetical protein
MSEFAVDLETGEDLPILVEFSPRPGVRQVSLSMAPEELAGKSALALDRAMSTVRQMAKRVTDAVDKITDKPDKVEVEFGLKLDAEAGAYIAKASTEAGFKVMLTWERPKASGTGG